MKKRLLGLLCTGALLLTGCGTRVTTYKDDEINLWNKFVVLEVRNDAGLGGLYTVYDKESCVMYYIWETASRGGISPIYNADGTVKIYNGE